MNERTDEWKFSPFYKTLSLIGAAAQKGYQQTFKSLWEVYNIRNMGDLGLKRGLLAGGSVLSVKELLSTITRIGNLLNSIQI